MLPMHLHGWNKGESSSAPHRQMRHACSSPASDMLSCEGASSDEYACEGAVLCEYEFEVCACSCSKAERVLRAGSQDALGFAHRLTRSHACKRASFHPSLLFHTHIKMHRNRSKHKAPKKEDPLDRLDKKRARGVEEQKEDREEKKRVVGASSFLALKADLAKSKSDIEAAGESSSSKVAPTVRVQCIVRSTS